MPLRFTAVKRLSKECHGKTTNVFIDEMETRSMKTEFFREG